jgi:hypothetical protein
MGSEKSTPGPWRVEAFSRSKHFRIHPSEGATPSGSLADVYSSEANARLIAAAPDLLEAVRHAVMEWRLHGQLTDSCRVLEAALAKAQPALGKESK